MQTTQQETTEQRIERERAAARGLAALRMDQLHETCDALDDEQTRAVLVYPIPSGDETSATGTLRVLTESGDECHIWCSADEWGNEGRWRFSISWPRDKTNTVHRAASQHITVSADKTPQQIARDISRRLLPEAFKQWMSAKAAADSADAYRAKCELAACNLASHMQSLGYEKAQPHGPTIDNNLRNYRSGTYGVYATSGPRFVEVGKDSVRMEIDCTVEQAMQVLAIIAPKQKG